MSISRIRRSGMQISSSPKKSRSLQDASGLPGPVQSLTATPTGNTTATISWSAPVISGDSSITSYTVTGGGSISVTGTSATVTGLTANTSYTFTVTAVSSLGNGATVSATPITTFNFNAASGGTETTVTNYNGTGQTWKVHEFTSGGTLTVSAAPTTFRAYIGGGNGGGQSSGCCGSCAQRASFGGQYTNDALSLSATSYSVVVGGGGAGSIWQGHPPAAGGAGGTSSFAGISQAGGAGGPSSAGSFTTSNIRGAGDQQIGNQSWSGACGDGYNGTNGIAGRVIVAYRTA